MLKGTLTPKVIRVEQCSLCQDKAPLDFENNYKEAFEYLDRL